MEFPDCEAVRVQMPTVRNEVCGPLTVQTFVVLETNVTANPEDAVAERVSGIPTVCAPGLLNVMLCTSGAWMFTVIAVTAVKLPDVPVTVTLVVPMVAPFVAVSVISCVPVAVPAAKEAETPLGRPAAARVTAPVNPPRLVTAMVSVVVSPSPNVNEELEGASVKPCVVEPYHFGSVTVAAGLFCGV